jgi:hypothetical protein
MPVMAITSCDVKRSCIGPQICLKQASRQMFQTF